MKLWVLVKMLKSVNVASETTAGWLLDTGDNIYNIKI